MDPVKKSMERAEILLEALPYIRRFYNKTIVIARNETKCSDVAIQELVHVPWIATLRSQ